MSDHVDSEKNQTAEQGTPGTNEPDTEHEIENEIDDEFATIDDILREMRNDIKRIDKHLARLNELKNFEELSDMEAYLDDVYVKIGEVKWYVKDAWIKFRDESDLKCEKE